ncbi:Hypothetical predicted protein, partial [Mytilus galloprovincialis]
LFYTVNSGLNSHGIKLHINKYCVHNISQCNFFVIRFLVQEDISCQTKTFSPLTIRRNARLAEWIAQSNWKECICLRKCFLRITHWWDNKSRLRYTSSYLDQKESGCSWPKYDIFKEKNAMHLNQNAGGYGGYGGYGGGFGGGFGGRFGRGYGGYGFGGGYGGYGIGGGYGGYGLGGGYGGYGGGYGKGKVVIVKGYGGYGGGYGGYGGFGGGGYGGFGGIGGGYGGYGTYLLSLVGHSVIKAIYGPLIKFSQGFTADLRVLNSVYFTIMVSESLLGFYETRHVKRGILRKTGTLAMNGIVNYFTGCREYGGGGGISQLCNGDLSVTGIDDLSLLLKKK